MHLPNKPSFEYLPGECVVVNPHEKMVIDFPLASEETPTQCMALAIDDQFVNQTLDYLNHYYSLDPDIHQPWQLINEQYHFKNDPFISQLVGKIIEIGVYQNRNDLIFADFSMKELIVRILQNQNLLSHQGRQPVRNQRLKEVTDYIDINLDQKIDMNRLFKVAGMSRCVFFKWFKQQVGLSPLEYIQSERIAKAKKLLQTKGHSVSDVAFECGFQDVNYFVRAFRLNEGLTPGQYQKQVVQLDG
jgi:AraC-like DNA-binding protein